MKVKNVCTAYRDKLPVLTGNIVLVVVYFYIILKNMFCQKIYIQKLYRATITNKDFKQTLNKHAAQLTLIGMQVQLS